MQAKRRMRHLHPTSAQGSGAKSAPPAVSTTSGLNPRAARNRAVRAPAPRWWMRPRARSPSGSRDRSASSRASAPIPRRSRSARIIASPYPREASAAARVRATRRSSIRPDRCSAPTASSRAAGATPRRSRHCWSCRLEWSRPASAPVAMESASARRTSRRTSRRSARSRARPTLSPARTTTSAGNVRQGAPSSSTATRPRRSSRSAVTVGTRAFLGRRLLFGFLGRRDLAVRLGRALRSRQQPRRDDLLRSELRLDARENRLAHVRMLAQERRRVLPALPEPLVVEREVRAGLLDDLPVETRIEHRALPRDPGAVDDVELGLLERRCALVLHDLHAHAVADRLDTFLQGLDAADF